MKATFKKAFLFIGIGLSIISCKNKSSAERNGSENKSLENTSREVSSLDPVQNKSRKFVRTADAKFEVGDVRKTTDIIENITVKFGGFVINSNLQSNVSERTETKISQDSLLKTTKFNVENNLSLRVPNTAMDTVLRSIGEQIKFLDFRITKADDVSLQLLSNHMLSKRSNSSEKRIEKAIDTKGKKLEGVLAAEEKLEAKKAENEQLIINSLSLHDQVNFSTISLQIYQKETITNEVVPNVASIDAYRPHIGLQIVDGLKTGWYMLEAIIALIAKLWSVILLVFLSFFFYKKYTRKTSL